MHGGLPTGTVTFLFTDIEGSTRLLRELGAEGYAAALAEHRRVLRDAFARHEGVEVDTQGDAFFVAFPTAPAALAAAAEATDQLATGPIRVRMGVHTGTPYVAEEGYVGGDVHRAARIAASAHGGQVVVSAATAALVDGVRLRDLGVHRFKDLAAPERVHQLGDCAFPPLRSLYRTNLPVPATTFIGRGREVEQIAGLLASADVRLVTLTGPGGTGKTRLALQAAAEAADMFPDGLTWLALAPIGAAELVVPTLAEALELADVLGAEPAHDLARALAGARAGLLIDNAEHLLPSLADELAPLLQVPGPTLLVTSRERLDLPGERVVAIDPLAEEEAVELFLARAGALGVEPADREAVADLCRRLDHLPLAVELAAARAPLFSPAQLLDRIGQRLDLLKGGRRADPRQQTLRATIEWSHDLLSEDERELFRRLAIFSGGCAYDAAEAIAGADPDTLQMLLDKSLIRRRDASSGPRYWMLETIREYAGERLAESGESETLAEAHATWFAQLAASRNRAVREGESEPTARVLDELPNLRVALARALETGDVETAGDVLFGLWFLWLTRSFGREAGEAAARWLEHDRSSLEPVARVPGLLGASEIIRFTGDPHVAATLKRELLDILEEHPDADAHGWGFAGSRAATFTDLASLELEWDPAAAEAHAMTALELRRQAGAPAGIAHALDGLAIVLRVKGDLERSREASQESLETWGAAGKTLEAAQSRVALAGVLLELGEEVEARSMLLEVIDAVVAGEDVGFIAELLRATSLLAASTGSWETAAALSGALDRTLAEAGLRRSVWEEQHDEEALAVSRSAGGTAWQPSYDRGRELELDAAVALAREHLARG